MDFEINLIKDRVPSLKKRKGIFLVIILYLTFCAIILVSFCYRMTTDFIEAYDYKKQIKLLEDKVYLPLYREKDIFNHALESKNQIARYIATLDGIDNVLSKRVDLTSILLRFYTALPAGAYIDNFKLDSPSKDLSFDVMLPAADETKNPFSTSELIALWKQDISLMSNIDNIKSSASHRQKRGKELLFISEFSCSLSKGAL